MPNQIQTLIRRSTHKNGEPLNIISFPTHETYQVGLGQTNNKFYLFRAPGQGVKEWDSTYRPVPPNTVLLNHALKEKQLPDYIDYDLVLEQNKGCQYNIARQISNQLKIPLISLTHFLPPPNYTKSNFRQYKAAVSDYNVFITDYNRQAWGYSENEATVIYHGIDTGFFKPNPEVERDGLALVVVNDFIGRGWAVGWQPFCEVTGYPHSQLLKFKALGNTPGFSLPSKSPEELLLAYQKCGVFLNTSLISPIPMSLLEAASVGCPICAMPTCAIPEIFTHGYNALLSNNPDQLRSYCKRLISDKDMAQELGANARKTILEKFSLEKFVDNWNSLFRRAVGNG